MGLNSVAMIMAPNMFLCTNKSQPTLQEIKHAQGTVNIVRMLIKYQAILWTVSKVTVKRATCFATPMKKSWKSNVARFTDKSGCVKLRCILTSDWIKLPGSHAKHGIYVTYCKISLPLPLKRATWTDFLAKSWAALHFLQQLFATSHTPRAQYGRTHLPLGNSFSQNV